MFYIKLFIFYHNSSNYKMSATEAFETTNSSIDDQEEGYIELLDESCVMPSEGWTTNEMFLFEGTVE